MGIVNARKYWVGCLPGSHALTIFIASRLRADRFYQDLEHEVLLQHAWKIQCTETPGLSDHIDVDAESLTLLEEEMFERSKEAGAAGNWQWGLDAGDHQGRWNPYEGLPPDWNHNDRDDESESVELERGPDFIEIRLPSPAPVHKERPRPRPLRRAA
ncbi:hypothetical protein H0H93_002476, partial [Arthromyces matolae]